MKVNKNFVLRKVGDCYVAVPVGSACRTFKGMVRMNETARMVWESLLTGDTEAQTVAKMLERYEVTETHAHESYHAVLDYMAQVGALSPED